MNDIESFVVLFAPNIGMTTIVYCVLKRDVEIFFQKGKVYWRRKNSLLYYIYKSLSCLTQFSKPIWWNIKSMGWYLQYLIIIIYNIIENFDVNFTKLLPLVSGKDVQGK